MLDCVIKKNRLTIKDKDGKSEYFTTFGERDKTFKIDGVYGIIKNSNSSLLVLVLSSSESGEILGSSVMSIRNIKVVKLSKNTSNLLTNLISLTFKRGGIYYSSYPLYKQFQDAKNSKNNIHSSSEFLFNSIPIKNYSDEGGIFPLFCIQGYFGEKSGICLISRRSYKRTGTRYLSRGSDLDGNISNFVETEQIIPDSGSSFLQLRGSIPLIWGHQVDFSYQPKLLIKGDASNNCHEKLVKNYGEIFYFNLIKPIGYEGEINNKYIEILSKKNYLSMDFHNKYKTVRKSIPFSKDQIRVSDQNKRQKVFIRTNCIDCLDRTNGAQYLIGLEALKLQIGEIDKEIGKSYKEMFLENGNNLSIQYAGTPALNKHVITESSFISRIGDGYYSLKRYYVNRVLDPNYNISYQLATGNFVDVENDYISLGKRVKCIVMLLNPILLLMMMYISIINVVVLILVVVYMLKNKKTKEKDN